MGRATAQERPGQGPEHDRQGQKGSDSILKVKPGQAEQRDGGPGVVMNNCELKHRTGHREETRRKDPPKKGQDSREVSGEKQMA